MAFELFKSTAGITAVPIAYEGGADALRAVVKGDAEMMMASLISAVPLIQEGKLRALAVTGRHPAQAAPELPTIAETLPGYSAVSWYGVLAPAGTPASKSPAMRVTIRVQNDMATSRRRSILAALAAFGVAAAETSPDGSDAVH
jgi:tripartite-type tricarboxylate transporter receptor subunit TctC